MTTSEANGPLWGARAADWAAIQEPTCAPVYRSVFARLGMGKETRYADLGCGSGVAAELAGGLGAEVLGLDASEALVREARRRYPAGEFTVGELESLPYATETFDVVTGFNSFQYAADPVQALREAKRAARRGGTVVVMCWGPPDGMEAAALVRALGPLLPAPPPGAPGPFALAEEAALRNFAERAGLRVREVVLVESPWQYASLECALRGLGSSGVAVRAAKRVGREAVDAAHAAALRPFLQADGGYRVGAAYFCLFADA